jgi:hypothetical protein
MAWPVTWRDRLGEVSLIATDILEQLPAAFRTWTG